MNIITVSTLDSMVGLLIRFLICIYIYMLSFSCLLCCLCAKEERMCTYIYAWRNHKSCK